MESIIGLAANGGGLRGALTMRLMQHLEEETGLPAYKIFKIIGGNSTGAIGGTALAYGYSAKEIVELYLKRGKDIFAKKPLFQRIIGLNGILDEKYDLNNLIKVVKEYVGESKMQDAKTMLMTAAYDLAEGKPFFFKSWKPEHKNIPMYVCAIASGAAPTYFEALEYAGRLFTDGGVMGVNNMSSVLETEMRKLFGKEANYKILNIGTGQYREKVSAAVAKKMGKLKAVKSVIDIQISGAADVAVYQTQINLGANYLEIDTQIPKELAPMDDWRNVPDLIKIADRVWEQRGKEILEFLKA